MAVRVPGIDASTQKEIVSSEVNVDSRGPTALLPLSSRSIVDSAARMHSRSVGSSIVAGSTLKASAPLRVVRRTRTVAAPADEQR